MESREEEMEEIKKEGKEEKNPSENFSKKWHAIDIYLNTNILP